MQDLKFYMILNKHRFQGYKQMPAMLSMEDRWKQGYITFQDYYDWVGMRTHARSAGSDTNE